MPVCHMNANVSNLICHRSLVSLGFQVNTFVFFLMNVFEVMVKSFAAAPIDEL